MNQPASNSKTWIIVGVIGVIGCVCILALGVVLGLGFRGGQLALPGLNITDPTQGSISIATQEPMIISTDTPLPPPPTDTPVPTVVPTFTAAPTQSVSTIVDMLRPAAEGRAVSDAAAYDPKKSGVHPIIVFSADKDIVDEWNAELPAAWRAQNVSLAELVAVVTNRNVQIERGHYFGSGVSLYIYRIRIDTEVILREAKTGYTVASQVFQGGEPPSLKSRFPVGTTAVYGTLVPYEIVELWLKSFVEK